MNASFPFWESGHDLPADVRRQMVALLNQQLADTITLGLQAKHAHWNVKGPQFVPLHALFDEAAEIITALTDEIAERVVELGGLADGTLPSVSAATRLPTYDRTLLAGAEHVRALGDSLAHCARTSRAAIDQASDAGDAATADLFTELTRAVDKLLWKTSAHRAEQT